MENSYKSESAPLDKMTDDLEKELTKDFAKPLPAVPSSRIPLRPVPPMERAVGTLTEQLDAYERVQTELRERVRREAMRMEHEFKMRRQTISSDYDVRIHEAIAELESRRDKELHALAQEFHDKARELDALKNRMD